MSRQIDWTQPLSDEDRAWAEQFSINHALIADNDVQHAAQAESLEGASLGEGADGVKPYSEWTKAELAAEVANRTLSAPASAKKDELVKLLEADDAAEGAGTQS